MSEAAIAFNRSINGAQDLLARFDEENLGTTSSNSEILKRAGMVMAMAAWETYIKDRIQEEFEVWLKPVEGSALGRFVQNKLDEDLKRFFNPNSERVKIIFKSYFEIDVTESWSWDNYNPVLAKKTLNGLISKRGDAAHRANTSTGSSIEPHLIKRDELEKAIRFLKGLVSATDKVRLAK